MAAKKASPAMDFIVEFLKKNKQASYAEIRAAAEGQQIAVYPIMYGRAQALLGLVASKPRGQGKAALAKAGKVEAAKAEAVEKRGPGRPAKTASAFDAGSLSSLEGIIAAVKNSEQARTRYRNALEKIQQILGSALG